MTSLPSRGDDRIQFAGRIDLERQGTYAASSQVILAVLAVIAALYLLKVILIPIAVALVLACMFSPLAALFRRVFPFGPVGALALFVLLVMGGLYVASLTAEISHPDYPSSHNLYRGGWAA